MGIGWFSLIVVAVLAIIALVCWLNPAPAPRRNTDADYTKIYRDAMPREL